MVDSVKGRSVAVSHTDDRKEMGVLLVRHGPRIRDGPYDEGKEPLTGRGRTIVRNLKDDLNTLLHEKGISPDVYVTSTYKHSIETAEILCKNRSGKDLIVECEDLDGGGNNPDIEEVKDALKNNDYVLSDLNCVAIIGHHPQIKKFQDKLAKNEGGRFLKRGDAVYLTVNSLTDLKAEEGEIVTHYHRSEGSETLEPKIRSKMAISTFLAGFIFNALINIIPDSGTSPPLLRSFAILLLTFSLLLFVISVYMYDRLAMPEKFWKSDEYEQTKGKNRTTVRERVDSKVDEWRTYVDKHDSFYENVNAFGYRYAYMVRIWRLVFTGAVAIAIVGFLCILASDLIQFDIISRQDIVWLSLVEIATVWLVYLVLRPELAVD